MATEKQTLVAMIALENGKEFEFNVRKEMLEMIKEIAEAKDENN